MNGEVIFFVKFEKSVFAKIQYFFFFFFFGGGGGGGGGRGGVGS